MTAPIGQVRPPRRCQGYQRDCSTLLSTFNMESICACCSNRRALAVIEAANASNDKARRALRAQA